MNFGINKFIITGQTSFLVNSFIFNSPSTYFPAKSKVPITKFVEKYVNGLINSFLPMKDIPISPGGYIDQINQAIDKMVNIYKTCLYEISSEFKTTYPHNFRISLNMFVRKINSLKYFVPDRTLQKLSNGISDYLLAISYNKNFSHAKILSKDGKSVNITVLESMFHYFGIYRTHEDGYSQKVDVFMVNNVKEDETKTE